MGREGEGEGRVLGFVRESWCQCSDEEPQKMTRRITREQPTQQQERTSLAVAALPCRGPMARKKDGRGASAR